MTPSDPNQAKIEPAAILVSPAEEPTRPPARAGGPVLTYPQSRGGLLDRLRPTLRYWMEVESHAYALSVAACVLLSFFPFLIVIVSLFRYVFEWPAGVQAIHYALADFFDQDRYEFIRRNLMQRVYERAAAGGAMQIPSLILLLFAANGVFVPLEVALNRSLGVARNRSYLKNQLVCYGLIFICGTLALVSFYLTAVNREFFAGLKWAPSEFGLFGFRAAGLGTTILALALMYWILPNTRIRFRGVVPTAIRVGLALEVLKWINRPVWPLLAAKLTSEYGPFYISVSILLWSFVAAMFVLAGAESLARRSRPEAEIP